MNTKAENVSGYTVSKEELALLNAPLKQIQPKSVDLGFKYRNIFLVVGACYFVSRNLFFPDLAFEFPMLDKSQPAFLLATQATAFFMFAFAVFYFVSYFRDWQFQRVGFIAFGMTLATLIRDLLGYFVLSHSPLSTISVIEIFLRFGILICIFVSALRDNRAPSMPRTPWS
jgi:uncharacterized RDD family membrane protein YckC